MSSVLAIVSKAVFEKQARGLGLGDVWPTDRYASKGKVLETLAEGGSLFLVTVRPPEELWLVGVLDAPEHEGDAWVAKANTIPIRSIHALIGKLVLASGNGLTYEKGKLGMSLQGPRVLADADVALLRAGAPSKTSGAKAGARSPAASSAAKRSASVVAAKRSVAEKRSGATVALDEVYAALDKQQPAKALERLIAIWKTARSPVLAEAIDALSAHLTPPALERAWTSVEKQATAAELGVLLANIREGTGVRGVADRIRRLQRKFAGDPRLASFVHTQLDALGFTASSSSGVWDVLFDVLELLPDPRTVAVVDATRARWDQKLAKRGGYHKRFLGWLDDVRASAAAVVAPEVSRDAIAPILAYGERAVGDDDRTLAALYAEVYKHPDDDHVRSVLADALVERGDPRGELIHLQLRTDPLSTDEKRRVKELVAEHGRDWLGALGEWSSKDAKELIYERGFATRMTIVKPPTSQPAYPVDAPEMATIETLDFGWSLPRFEKDPELRRWIRAFPRVRRLEVGSVQRLASLVADGPLPYVEIVVTDPRRAAWFTRNNFPNLERIILPYKKGTIEVAKDWTFRKGK
jgi:uncharacterized protein (TIGR02996 family)